MQIANRLATATAGDGLSNLTGRPAGPTVAAGKEDATAQAVQAGFFDPTPRISLSVDALLYLSRAKKTPEKLPALTKDEWNNSLSPQLAAREHQAFGKFAESGDYKTYYRSFIEYFDSLRPEDQDSLRYFGTREAAVAGLRSLEYDSESGLDVNASFKRIVSVFLDEDKTASSTVSSALAAADEPIYGWDASKISYELESPEPRSLSEIERLYAELL
ncbi:hypothetical protein J2Z31_004589 [Sinorhizobium kostiense]|uniref:Biotin biosynthesis protein BioC n=1 Tax=Sinorhizobium kostiense TaxID=76747 RepID=A0ABS4R594_9HYPH|nr:biotin biosynthesis protein BioC [Sinorhizobium kostiense]MBP2238062.1 hypothetical protein [Sinorhizobium kostiense]